MMVVKVVPSSPLSTWQSLPASSPVRIVGGRSIGVGTQDRAGLSRLAVSSGAAESRGGEAGTHGVMLLLLLRRRAEERRRRRVLRRSRRHRRLSNKSRMMERSRGHLNQRLVMVKVGGGLKRRKRIGGGSRQPERCSGRGGMVVLGRRNRGRMEECCRCCGCLRLRGRRMVRRLWVQQMSRGYKVGSRTSCCRRGCCSGLGCE